MLDLGEIQATLYDVATGLAARIVRELDTPKGLPIGLWSLILLRPQRRLASSGSVCPEESNGHEFYSAAGFSRFRNAERTDWAL